MDREFCKHAKLQSAMEYLMTYGWAILIIAVVLGALFQLGIFNASTFTPKAPPGACHVFRPNGPSTTSFINLQGICNGELPQYVASFQSPAYVLMSASSALQPTSAITVSMWLNFPGFYGETDTIRMGPGAFNYRLAMNSAAPYRNIFWQIYVNGIEQSISSQNFAPNTWYLVTATYGSGFVTLYVNGVSSSSVAATGSITETSGYQLELNAYDASAQTKLQMANVQLYNSSLSSNEIIALYNEGIGGAPVKLSNLVGWWPLNGDAKDYSGNNNNGVPTTGVSFTSSWESGYSAP